MTKAAYALLSITNEAIEQLGLKEGGKAAAIIKSTNVMVAVD